jgi:Asp-tRNA(Asn)/Glu-tRNA(Gln) amidotransferase A subunit family amidase
MKVMISQPMNGKTEEQIKTERAELVEKLKEDGHEILDTVFEDFDENASPIAYLAKSIEFIDKADCIVFMEGWNKARGCKIEHEVAVNYGKKVIYCN